MMIIYVGNNSPCIFSILRALIKTNRYIINTKKIKLVVKREEMSLLFPLTAIYQLTLCFNKSKNQKIGTKI